MRPPYIGFPGLDGKPRQLHTLEARDAIDFHVYPDYRTHYAAPAEASSDAYVRSMLHVYTHRVSRIYAQSFTYKRIGMHVRQFALNVYVEASAVQSKAYW